MESEDGSGFYPKKSFKMISPPRQEEKYDHLKSPTLATINKPCPGRDVLTFYPRDSPWLPVVKISFCALLWIFMAKSLSWRPCRAVVLTKADGGLIMDYHAEHLDDDSLMVHFNQGDKSQKARPERTKWVEGPVLSLSKEKKQEFKDRVPFKVEGWEPTSSHVERVTIYFNDDVKKINRYGDPVDRVNPV